MWYEARVGGGVYLCISGLRFLRYVAGRKMSGEAKNFEEVRYLKQS